MKILTWNIRGLGKPSKRRLPRDLLKEDLIDIFTMKETFQAKLKDIILPSIYPNSF